MKNEEHNRAWPGDAALHILHRKVSLQSAGNCGRWCIISVFLLMFVVLDMLTLSDTMFSRDATLSKSNSLMQQILMCEHAVIYLLLLIVLYNGVRYIWPFIGYQIIFITPQQRIIYDIPENVPTFLTVFPHTYPSPNTSPANIFTSTPTHKNLSNMSSPYTPTASPFSSFSSSHSTPQQSPSQSLLPPPSSSSPLSWFRLQESSWFQQSPSLITPNSSILDSGCSWDTAQTNSMSFDKFNQYEPSTDITWNASMVDLSEDKAELQAFLKEQAARERREAWLLYRQQLGFGQNESQDLLKYLSPFTPPSKPLISTLNNGSRQQQSMTLNQFCSLTNTSVNSLEIWIENLRLWLSQTIIARIVHNILETNSIFKRFGLDVTIGTSSIGTLRQVAVLQQHHLSTLEQLISFLDINSNQQYIVGRLKELGSSTCLGGYNWQGGGTFKGKAWDEHLLSDSSLIFHILCTYMDSQLRVHPKAADGKTFTKLYTVRTPDKPDPRNYKSGLCIYQCEINPPQFKLIAYGKVYNIPEGRNNLFLTILLFLHFIKTKESCMLGPAYFGATGINVMWIIES